MESPPKSDDIAVLKDYESCAHSTLVIIYLKMEQEFPRIIANIKKTRRWLTVTENTFSPIFKMLL